MCSVQDRANHVASRETNLKLWKASRDDISQALRNSAKPMPKMSSGGPKTPSTKKRKLLQNVAECCKMLQDTISRNREVRQSQEPPHRNRRPEITLKSRNPVLRNFHPCNVASPSPQNLARRATPRHRTGAQRGAWRCCMQHEVGRIAHIQ